MATALNCVDSGGGSTDTKEIVIVENDDTMVISGKAAADSSPETVTDIVSNQLSGAPNSSSRSQKSKKRQNQKTFSLFEIFDMHQGIGSWADAAADVNVPSNSLSTQQKSMEAEETSRQNCTSQREWIQCPVSSDGNRIPSSITDRASHSRNVDSTNMPDRPPFEIKVTNINYKSSDNDLMEFFGGDRNVVSIRSEGTATRRGTAIISFSSQEALANALNLNGVELRGRSLRISLRDYQPRFSFNSSNNVGLNCGYGQYRNNGSYHHEGGYKTLPHPRRTLPPPPCHSYNSANRLPSFQFSSYRGRDNRRYDYDSRSVRHSRPGNKFYPRHVNRSFNSYAVQSRPPLHSENHYIHHVPDVEHDDEKRDSRRIRTESVRSSTTDATERHERRKLQLQPRTKPLDNAKEELPVRPTSIFGLAKPVDTTEKERQAEERLRLENQALKAAEQRSRKSSSEHGPSLPTSPVLSHGHVSIMKLSEDCENYPPAMRHFAPNVKLGAVEVTEKARSTTVMPKLVVNENVIIPEEPLTPANEVTPLSQLPSASSFPTPRRQSFSNCSEVSSEARPTSTLPRARNNYNRTFIRSRDSLRDQISFNKQQNISARRGKSGFYRYGTDSNGVVGSDGGSVTNGNKISTSGKERTDGNNAEPEAVVLDKQKPLESKSRLEQQSAPKEQKRDLAKTSNSAVKQSVQKTIEQLAERQQYSKKEKRKQTAVVKDSSKIVEPKLFTFSSENRYAALLEADD